MDGIVKGMVELVFHIEHIKSQNDNKDLIDEYSNLALSCPICNTTKIKNPSPSDLDPLGKTIKIIL